MECLDNFSPHLIAADADGWPQGCEQPLRLGAKKPAHLAHRLFDDARQRSAPARVDSRHRAMLSIHQQNRHTIRAPHRQENTGLISQQGVARRQRAVLPFQKGNPARATFRFPIRSARHKVNVGGVDLPEGSELKTFRAELREEKLAIPVHPGAPVPLRESQVQS